MEEKTCRTISLSGSKYSWNDVDKRVNESNLPTCSKYIQSLVEHDIEGFNMSFKDIFITISLLLIICLTVIILVVIA